MTIFHQLYQIGIRTIFRIFYLFLHTTNSFGIFLKNNLTQISISLSFYHVEHSSSHAEFVNHKIVLGCTDTVHESKNCFNNVHFFKSSLPYFSAWRRFWSHNRECDDIYLVALYVIVNRAVYYTGRLFENMHDAAGSDLFQSCPGGF